jgi:GNAT superfamily N-acetyltransferase
MLTVSPLELKDIGRFLALGAEIDADSGVDGGAHSHPYSASEPLDVAAAYDEEVGRWSSALDQPGWRRAWGLFDIDTGDEMVGQFYLGGGALASELHRAECGMGVRRAYRRRGGGRLLFETAIAWARAQPTIDWLDLSVFHDNPGQILYPQLGFEVTGRVRDRYRVDGFSIDDILMSLNVAR